MTARNFIISALVIQRRHVQNIPIPFRNTRALIMYKFWMGGLSCSKNYIDFKILQSVKFFFCGFFSFGFFCCFASLPDDSSILKFLISFTVSFGFVLVSVLSLVQLLSIKYAVFFFCCIFDHGSCCLFFVLYRYSSIYYIQFSIQFYTLVF